MSTDSNDLKTHIAKLDLDKLKTVQFYLKTLFDVVDNSFVKNRQCLIK